MYESINDMCAALK